MKGIARFNHNLCFGGMFLFLSKKQKTKKKQKKKQTKKKKKKKKKKKIFSERIRQKISGEVYMKKQLQKK